MADVVCETCAYWQPKVGSQSFGFPGDEIRLALAHAALREGRKIGDLATAVALVAAAALSVPAWAQTAGQIPFARCV